MRPRKGTRKYYFDHLKAQRAVKFFHENLVHLEDPHAGKPFILEGWQRQIIEDVFGWYRKKDKTRRYREVYIEIPRKNGKSTLAAGIALYLLFADEERGAQIFSAAADKKQAKVVFKVAAEMIRKSPRLSKLAAPFKDSIPYHRLGSIYEAISADANTKHGANLHATIFDELHAQPNRDLYDVLRTSSGTRRQPLSVYLTTAGYDRNSICWERHEHALRVIDDPSYDEAFYAVVYSIDKDDDWADPNTWYKANPNLGVSVTLDYLQRECEEAKKNPAYENTFRRLHLNQWTEQETRMIPMSVWDECVENFDIESFHGRECTLGLDLASREDIAAVTLVFPPTGEDLKYTVIPYFFIPRENVEKRFQSHKVPYPQWVDEGLIFATEGDIIDYDAIRVFIRDELNSKFNIREIAFDRWNATQLTTQLKGDGFEVIPIGQGFYHMDSPCKDLLALISGRRFRHNGNKVLRWMAGNTSAEMDAEKRIRPSKKKSGEKIDGIVATLMGLARLQVTTAVEPSVYEERGILVL